MSAVAPSGDSPAVLVLIHDAEARARTLEVLAPLACSVIAENTAEAEAMLRLGSYGVLIVEDELPGETGLMFLARINHQYPWLRRILVCGELEADLLVFLINEANVFRCVTKPIAGETFRPLLRQALADHERMRTLAASAAEGDRLRAELAAPGHRLQRLAALTRHWLVSLPQFALLAVLGAVGLFGLGVVVLLALYVLKTFLGIDLIEGAHLRDLFR